MPAARPRHNRSPLPHLDALINAIAVRYRAMVALAARCGLRFGELIELRRKDVNVRDRIVHVRRAAVLVDGVHVIGDPKSEAGSRTVTVPPHVVLLVRRHDMRKGVTGRDALLFPAAGDPDQAPAVLDAGEGVLRRAEEDRTRRSPLA